MDLYLRIFYPASTCSSPHFLATALVFSHHGFNMQLMNFHLLLSFAFTLSLANVLVDESLPHKWWGIKREPVQLDVLRIIEGNNQIQACFWAFQSINSRGEVATCNDVEQLRFCSLSSNSSFDPCLIDVMVDVFTRSELKVPCTSRGACRTCSFHNSVVQLTSPFGTLFSALIVLSSCIVIFSVAMKLINFILDRLRNNYKVRVRLEKRTGDFEQRTEAPHQ